MSDEKLRRLERVYAESGGPEDYAALLREQTRQDYYSDEEEEECGLCGEPGADKMAIWTGGGVYWPGERRSETEFVHAECERDETNRAFSELSVDEREACVRSAWLA